MEGNFVVLTIGAPADSVEASAAVVMAATVVVVV